MPKITKLTRQKHNENRVSVFVDDEYAFSILDELIIEYGISLNMDVSLLPLDKIKEEDDYKYCLSVAFKHFSASDKSEKQMRDFLHKKGFSEDSVEKVILRLKELNYIDDRAFARTFVEHSKKSGKRALIYKLQSKGISQEDIDLALENESDEIQEEKALDLAKKQLPKYAKLNDFEKKQKLNAFLIRHGFTWDIVSTVMKN